MTMCDSTGRNAIPKKLLVVLCFTVVFGSIVQYVHVSYIATSSRCVTGDCMQKLDELKEEELKPTVVSPFQQTVHKTLVDNAHRVPNNGTQGLIVKVKAETRRPIHRKDKQRYINKDDQQRDQPVDGIHKYVIMDEPDLIAGKEESHINKPKEVFQRDSEQGSKGETLQHNILSDKHLAENLTEMNMTEIIIQKDNETLNDMTEPGSNEKAYVDLNQNSIPVCPRMTPVRKVMNVSCALIMAGNRRELLKVKYIKAYRYNRARFAPDNEVANYTSNCSSLRSRYRTCASSKDELNYPIAYSILCHKDAAQVEHLLRTIYQPQNVFCIYPDPKSNIYFQQVMENIAECLPNVFIAFKRESVVYTSFSRLQAEINCFKDLLRRPEKWKYLLNLAGQAFPLKTNKEVVSILKIYNGANDIEGLALNQFMHFRTRYRYAIVDGNLIKTSQRKTGDVPGNLKLVKGSAYGVFSRDFVHYVMKDELPKTLLAWSKDTKTPDEHYWATLNHLYHNPGLKSPGGYHRVPEKKPFLAVYVAWKHVNPCHGEVIRDLCVFGVRDLSFIITRKHLFANKFMPDIDPLTLDCMGEWYTNRTLTAPYFNLTYYKHLPFIIP